MIKLIAVTLFLGALVACGVWTFTNNYATDSDNTKKAEVQNNNTNQVSKDEETKSIAYPGEYISYTESLLTDATIGTKVLFFYAPWCPQCRELDASIKAGEIPAGVTIIKVDYDSNQSLRSRYGVTIQTSLVKIDDNGELVKKYVAYDEPSLQSLVENLL